ncbi:hypothetical protein [Hymenobacter glacieicola]|uniref:Uncharacterized protein n=1 Tax=Hymenobacter glacieicola TaxID=1562124 RepID=A0ABQ1WZW8_9BACT|nr:hypothetical protein [Hymenobacter glacieicola]GGG52801.1 hypothetical protein GCM10011378_31320 [Hymenobacter glacieicola]
MEQELQGLRQEAGGLRQEMNHGFTRMESAGNNMTTAVLDAMNRQTDRYDKV